MRNFLIVKIAHFGNVMSIDMTLPKWAIFTIGVYGEILCLLQDPFEISFMITTKIYAYDVNFSSNNKKYRSYHQKLFDILI